MFDRYEDLRGTVFNLMKYSTRDGPGLRTTVFLKGCPLVCAWCHNPESQSFHPEMVYRENRCIGCGACVEACVQKAIVPWQGALMVREDLCDHCGRCVEVCPTEARETIGREMSVSEVMFEVMKDLPFYEESGGGVTFSGGEPLSQPEFLTALLDACKKEELHVAVDTSGAVAFDVFERILPMVDLFLYDLKIMDDDLHLREVGASNGRILDNLKKLDRAGKTVWIRVPVIPGVTDGEENVPEIARFVASMENIRDIMLLPYHETGLDKYRLLGRTCRLPHVARPSRERLEEMAGVFESYGLKPVIGL